MEAACISVPSCSPLFLLLTCSFFNWNKEEIRMTADKVATICDHEKNYLPFYLMFGQVPIRRFRHP